MTVILKLGGSVITRKETAETIDSDALDQAAAAIADTSQDIVIVHGGGSFGHHHADRHGVTRTDGTRSAEAVVDIHDAMNRLNDAVIESVQAHGVPAVPVHPFSVANRDRAGDLTLPTGSIERMLAEGFVPVLHGDVVSHRGAGVTVLSGDELVVALAEALDAERAGLCSAVPGVLDETDDVIPRIETFADVSDVLGGSDTTDVTGGMAGKVRALLTLSVPASIFALGDLEAFLAGETPGTLIESESIGET